jgi:hypothetical protein
MKRDHYFNVFYRKQDARLCDLRTLRARFPQVNGHTPLRCYSVVVHHGGEGFLCCRHDQVGGLPEDVRYQFRSEWSLCPFPSSLSRKPWQETYDVRPPVGVLNLLTPSSVIAGEVGSRSSSTGSRPEEITVERRDPKLETLQSGLFIP